MSTLLSLLKSLLKKNTSLDNPSFANVTITKYGPYEDKVLIHLSINGKTYRIAADHD